MTVRVINGGVCVDVAAEKGETLLSVCERAGVCLCADCGGMGICGKCRVRCAGGVSAPTDEEISFLGDEINAGVRLACMARVVSDATVTLFGDASLQLRLPDDVDVPEDTLCVDLGTTNICIAYRDNGKTVAASFRNPQCIYGADVISRICAADGKLCKMRECVHGVLDGFSAKKRIISGNTAMQLLYCGIDPASLGRAPYLSPELFGKWINNDYLSPCVGAFVGGDVALGLYYAVKRGIVKTDENAIYLDIGTNGETVLIHNGEMTACAAAAGPCFEGCGVDCGMRAADGAIYDCRVGKNGIEYSVIGDKEPVGICGTGLVSLISCLLETGDITETGLLTEEKYRISDTVYITRRDVRAFQSAKAAIFAGIEILCRKAQISVNEIDTVYLAGSFGDALNVECAVRTGLIPNAATHLTGNCSLYGACLLGNDVTLCSEAEAFAQAIRYIELSNEDDFEQVYISSMAF